MNKRLFVSSLLLSAFSLTGCATIESVKVTNFDSIQLFTLKNSEGLEVKVTNYGARITSIITPDRDGKLDDIVLGYDHFSSYVNAIKRPYFGATLGRCANRIAEGKFTLGGQPYQLPTNNGPHHLHGGAFGFDKVIWLAEITGPNSVRFSYLSKDGEEGYPGNLNVSVTYTLTDKNSVYIDYHATTDQATPVNLSNHSYFNLKGDGEGTILDHQLSIKSKTFTPIDASGIPTGEIRAVKGTPFDFTQQKTIGRDIEQTNQQLEYGHGYDHNFVLEKFGRTRVLTHAATVYEPTTGRFMEVLTTEPGLQLYTANFLAGNLIGKSGKPYLRRGAFCLETQHAPDSPNQPNFPSIILRPGEQFKSTTMYKFSTR